MRSDRKQKINICNAQDAVSQVRKRERRAKSNYIRLQRKRKGSNSLEEDEWEETNPTSQLLHLLPSSSNNLYFLC